MLRVVDDVIAMHGLLWPDEIRATDGVAPESDVTVRDAELDLADALMATLGEVDMDTLHDDYREAVETLIASKASGEALQPAASDGHGGGKVIDLIAALENSVRAAMEARGEEPEEAERAPVAKVTSLAGRKKSGGTGAKKKAASTATSTGRKAAAKKTTPGRTPPRRPPHGRRRSRRRRRRQRTRRRRRRSRQRARSRRSGRHPPRSAPRPDDWSMKIGRK